MARRDELELDSHTNESVAQVRWRIAAKLSVEAGQISIVSIDTGEEVEANIAESKLLYQVGKLIHS